MLHDSSKGKENSGLGRRRRNEESDDEDNLNSGPRKRPEQMEHGIFLKLMKLNPGLETRVMKASEEELHYVADMLNNGSSRARSDDTRSLKSAIIDWITPPGGALVPPLSRNVKTDRGFFHYATGKLLCPATLDWEDEAVRKDLRSGEIAVSGDLWPIFLYHNHSFNPENPWDGLFKGRLLVSAFKHVFTSPSSVEQDTRATRSGNAELHGMKSVTTASLAYIATLVRFALGSSAIFSRNDKSTDSERFYRSILQFLESPSEAEEVQELIEWWNKRIFPTYSSDPSGESSSGRAVPSVMIIWSVGVPRVGPHWLSPDRTRTHVAGNHIQHQMLPALPLPLFIFNSAKSGYRQWYWPNFWIPSQTGVSRADKRSAVAVQILAVCLSANSHHHSPPLAHYSSLDLNSLAPFLAQMQLPVSAQFPGENCQAMIADPRSVLQTTFPCDYTIPKRTRIRSTSINTLELLAGLRYAGSAPLSACLHPPSLLLPAVVPPIFPRLLSFSLRTTLNPMASRSKQLNRQAVTSNARTSTPSPLSLENSDTSIRGNQASAAGSDSWTLRITATQDRVMRNARTESVSIYRCPSNTSGKATPSVSDRCMDMRTLEEENLMPFFQRSPTMIFVLLEHSEAHTFARFVADKSRVKTYPMTRQHALVKWAATEKDHNAVNSNVGLAVTHHPWTFAPPTGHNPDDSSPAVESGSKACFNCGNVQATSVERVSKAKVLSAPPRRIFKNVRVQATPTIFSDANVQTTPANFMDADVQTIPANFADANIQAIPADFADTDVQTAAAGFVDVEVQNKPANPEVVAVQTKSDTLSLGNASGEGVDVGVHDPLADALNGKVYALCNAVAVSIALIMAACLGGFCVWAILAYDAKDVAWFASLLLLPIKLASVLGLLLALRYVPRLTKEIGRVAVSAMSFFIASVVRWGVLQALSAIQGTLKLALFTVEKIHDQLSFTAGPGLDAYALNSLIVRTITVIPSCTSASGYYSTDRRSNQADSARMFRAALTNTYARDHCDALQPHRLGFSSGASYLELADTFSRPALSNSPGLESFVARSPRARLFPFSFPNEARQARKDRPRATDERHRRAADVLYTGGWLGTGKYFNLILRIRAIGAYLKVAAALARARANDTPPPSSTYNTLSTKVRDDRRDLDSPGTRGATASWEANGMEMGGSANESRACVVHRFTRDARAATTRPFLLAASTALRSRTRLEREVLNGSSRTRT
ncbi:hypothetical protein NMY22_g16344 [Coprinellus aureogranulatus]|nr:hypothetical protein NMY22_g16344 [Coprinellus aureogranulatus]